MDRSGAIEGFKSPSLTPKRKDLAAKEFKQKGKIGRPKKPKATDEGKQIHTYSPGNSPLDLSTKKKHFFYQDRFEMGLLTSPKQDNKRNREVAKKPSRKDVQNSLIKLRSNSVDSKEHKNTASLGKPCTLELTCKDVNSDLEMKSNSSLSPKIKSDLEDKSFPLTPKKKCLKAFNMKQKDSL